MKKGQTWLKVICPACEAPAGVSCRFGKGYFGLRHRERAEAARCQFGTKVEGLGRAIDYEVHGYVTRRWSSWCKRGHPEKCSGYRRVNRVGLVPCTNPWHKVTSLDVTKVVVTES